MDDSYDPGGQTPKFINHKLYYIYLRSRLDLENDDKAAPLSAVASLLGHIFWGAKPPTFAA
jgi:hypothetical protein